MAEAELVGEARAVRLHALHAHAHSLGDLAVRESVRERREHLELAPAQLLRADAPRRRRLRIGDLLEPPAEADPDVAAAAHHRADGTNELGVRRLLHEVAVAPRR